MNKLWQIKYRFKNNIYYDYSTFEISSKAKFIDFWNNKKVFFKEGKIVLGAVGLYELMDVILTKKIDG